MKGRRIQNKVGKSLTYTVTSSAARSKKLCRMQQTSKMPPVLISIFFIVLKRIKNKAKMLVNILLKRFAFTLQASSVY